MMGARWSNDVNEQQLYTQWNDNVLLFLCRFTLIRTGEGRATATFFRFLLSMPFSGYCFMRESEADAAAHSIWQRSVAHSGEKHKVCILDENEREGFCEGCFEGLNCNAVVM